MRNLLSNLLARPAATGWLRAGILVLLLATFAALAAPSTGAEPVQTTSAHAAITTVHVAEGDSVEAVAVEHGGDIVAWLRNADDLPMPNTDGVHAWAG